MDGFTQEALARMPLAQAVLTVWGWIGQERQLRKLFEKHRGRSYEKVITFETLVHLVCDALIEYQGSGRRSFERGRQRGELKASEQAAYKKLGRLPVQLSEGFLAECTERLGELFPAEALWGLPESLAAFRPVILDGKAIKHVTRRLKALRGVRQGAVGGRALVALNLTTGLSVAMSCHPDGDANDVRFTPTLLPEVRRRVGGVRLWVADRAFGYLEQLERFCQEEDHFLVRRRSQIRLKQDASRVCREGRTTNGRYVEAWGWVGNARNPQGLYVRQITLFRDDYEEVILLTDLLDAETYPASDLLAMYLERWGIERMFQEVTEVFGLKGLIGATPEATLFQFAFCMVLYNIIQVVRAYVAAEQDRPVATVSTEKLFGDVKRELIAWNVLIPPQQTVRCLPRHASAAAVRGDLVRLLQGQWRDAWIKSPRKKRPSARRHPIRKGRPGGHVSVHRLLRKQSSKSAKTVRSGQ
jgi:hypothetical protein